MGRFEKSSGREVVRGEESKASMIIGMVKSLALLWGLEFKYIHTYELKMNTNETFPSGLLWHEPIKFH